MKTILATIKQSGVALAALALTTACTGLLDEQPRSNFDPAFFETEQGIEGGITSMYAHLRYIYGQGYYYNNCETGTDEYTWGSSADGNFKDADLSGVGNLTSTSCRADVLWGAAFTNINTCNGVIKNGPVANVAESLISEARFFRAFDYFQLVQTFGGVPLDLGSGELEFNTTPVRTSVRNTVPEVYTKCIFPDLLTAIQNLPENPRLPGAVTKNVARLHLAKAYLTYGWWLQNPNNIPTYPEVARQDPDGHDAAWYFQQAYDVAVTAIDNPGPYALQPTFFDVNNGPNDRNSEIMLFADHTDESQYYNGGDFGWGSGGAPENFACWMPACGAYEHVRGQINGENVRVVLRTNMQTAFRPWTRMAPPHGVFTKTFADKTNDSRYDGTFETVYRHNSNNLGTVQNANGLNVDFGDPVLSLLTEDDPAIVYPTDNGKSDMGAGTIPGRADYVVGPSGFSRYCYPTLWKLGPYTTKGNTVNENAASTRPFNIAKFSEFYLVAAEAAVKGATTKSGKDARDLVNVLRARAGKWSFSNAENQPVDADYSAEMVAATPATIDIDYILAERSREFFGEGYRWFDLVRTQKWNEYADTYVICGTNRPDHTPQTFQRTILPTHYLRPIPQGQLDGMEMTAAEKEAYQNPGYR